MHFAFSARALLLGCLGALSAATLRLTPELAGTLAERTPADPLFYFELQPQSAISRAGPQGLLAQLQEDQQWIAGALERLPDTDKELMSWLLSDAGTRMATSVFTLKKGVSGDARVEFLAMAQASEQSFAGLVELIDRYIRRAIPPGHYIPMQARPRIGVMVGEPPKRLYVYEDFPVYIVSNSPDLVLRALEIRYKGAPALAGQADFQKMLGAVSGTGGAMLYVSVPGLIRHSGLVAVPFVAALTRTLNLRDWQVLGYHWDNVAGQAVRRTILLEGK
ncbi:MAG: hypothetical protein HYX74_09855 [Acidobacteria bacterium]|nr:hypothetical protein [Acidobacteriota bacterium]